jgi:Mg2+ and Co2+ transporter CorA
MSAADAPVVSESHDPRDALIDELRDKVMNLELSLLHSRDFAIGAIAETGELRLANAEANIHINNHLIHIAELNTRIEKLRKRLRRMADLEAKVNSRTYKVGRLVMLPVRIVKRLAR